MEFQFTLNRFQGLTINQIFEVLQKTTFNGWFFVGKKIFASKKGQLLFSKRGWPLG